MERFGSDKPDLRFGLEIVDIGAVAAVCDFGVFKGVMSSGGRVRESTRKALAEKYSRRLLDVDLKNFVGDFGAKGLAYMKVVGDKLESTIVKFFTEEQQREILTRMDGKDGDLLLFVADTPKVTNSALAALRNRLGKELKLYDPAQFQCQWVLDFPLVTWNADENRFDAEHHPFCQPNPEDAEFLKTDPSKVRA